MTLATASLTDLFTAIAHWQVFGPIAPPPAVDEWLQQPQDAAVAVPTQVAVGGSVAAGRLMDAVDGVLDFRALYGAQRGRVQASAYCTFRVDAPCTVRLAYEVDYYAAIWLDGAEVGSARSGNQSDQVIEAALEPGEHLLSARVITGSRGWSLRVRVLDIIPGIAPRLRTDRAAPWRDYRRTLVRYEHRPTPEGRCGALPMIAGENLLLNHGVDARWITTFHDLQGSYVPSAVFPLWKGAKPSHADQVMDWVRQLHRQRTCAMMWLPLVINEEGWKANPSWRMAFLREPGPDAHDRFACCINTAYGDAVIAYAIEMLTRYDFDGIYYDGSFFNPGWNRPLPVGCVCAACNAAFTAATGLQPPNQLSWEHPSFASWIAWRYRMFAAYWQRLVDTVHAVVPEATIAFNVYHREGGAWQAAIPWTPFGSGFLAATEADGEPLKGAWHARMMRAYGRPDNEVWMYCSGLRTTVRGPEHQARKVLDFALATCLGGAIPSLGGNHPESEAASIGRFADAVRTRAPWLQLPEEPCIALHLSQQTGDFVFGRHPDYPADSWDDTYGHAMTGWHHALAHAGFSIQAVFDEHLTMLRHPVVISPFAIALSVEQRTALEDHAHRGGVVIIGPWYGLCGADGGVPFDWSELAKPPQALTCLGQSLWASPVADASVDAIRDLHDMLTCQRRGKGWLIQCAIDLGGLFRATGAAALVTLIRDLVRTRWCPPVEILDGLGGLEGKGDALLGLFRQGRTLVAHVQILPPPWVSGDARPQRWGLRLGGQGPAPTVRVAIPEPGPALPVMTTNHGWSVELPPIQDGTVVLIEEPAS